MKHLGSRSRGHLYTQSCMNKIWWRKVKEGLVRSSPLPPFLHRHKFFFCSAPRRSSEKRPLRGFNPWLVARKHDESGTSEYETIFHMRRFIGIDISVLTKIDRSNFFHHSSTFTSLVVLSKRGAHRLYAFALNPDTFFFTHFGYVVKKFLKFREILWYDWNAFIIFISWQTIMFHVAIMDRIGWIKVFSPWENCINQSASKG